MSSRVLVSLLGLVLAGGSRLNSAGVPAGPAHAPTDIVSDGFDSTTIGTETTTFFTGHVVVTGTNLKINCDRLKVISDRQEGKGDPSRQGQKFKYFLATGHVHIMQLEREATCGRAEVFLAEDRMVLTDEPVVTDHSNNSVATGEKLILLHGEQKVTGTHVRITGPPIKDIGLDKSLPSAPPAAQPAR
jgi:lipopolysaccharide export system protein LptA